jgi:hypothetical protein
MIDIEEIGGFVLQKTKRSSLMGNAIGIPETFMVARNSTAAVFPPLSHLVGDSIEAERSIPAQSRKIRFHLGDAAVRSGNLDPLGHRAFQS